MTANQREQTRLYYLALREQYRRDFPLFALDALYIETKVAGQIKTLDIRPKPLQQMVWAKAQQQLKTIGYIDGNIIKGRQQGSSTISQGMLFWKSSLNRNYNTLLIAQDEPTTRSVFEKARFFYEHLPAWLKPAIRKSNRIELVFAATESKRHVEDHGLGSTMNFQSATNMLAGTGTTRQALHLSECAKYRGEDIDVLVASVYPIIYRGPGSIRLKESTAFMAGLWFRECCEEARDGRTKEFLVFCPAYLEPDNHITLDPKDPNDRDLARMVGLDAEEKFIVKTAKRGQAKYDIPSFEISPEYLKFRRVTIAQPGWDEDLWHEEYPTTFEQAWISRDSRALPHEKLYEMRKHIKQPLRFVVWDDSIRRFIDDPNGRLAADNDYIAIWEEPKAGENYDIGADVAAGIPGGDWSAAPVWKRRTREQVAELHLHIDPSDYGTLLYHFGTWYHNAQIAAEWTGGYGLSTDTQLKRMNYPNIHFWKLRGEIVPKMTRKTGWQTTRESKAYFVSYLRHFLNHDQVTLRSQVLLNECFNYIRIPYGDGYEYRAEHGHDDLVTAGAIGLVISDDENLGRLNEVEVLKSAPPPALIHLVDDVDLTRLRQESRFALEIRGGG